MSEQKINAVIKKFASYLKQEMEGKQEETLERVLRKHCALMSRHSWKIAQNWCKWDKNNGPILFPDCTRLYYRKGETEIVVQEFKPQIRILKFRGDLVSALSNKTHTYSLALPYTVFVFQFKKGMFSGVYMAFSDRPLKRMDEQPMLPYLPNINTDLKVCLGKAFNEAGLQKDQINQQCVYVLDYFWNSVYNADWATNFMNSRSHFESIGDTRMISLQNWQDASGEDPLFVIDDVQWLPCRLVSNFGDLCVRLAESDEEDWKFREEFFQGLNDPFIKEAKEACGDKLDAVINKLIEDKMKEFIKAFDRA